MGNDASKAPVFTSASTAETGGSLNGDPTAGKTASLAPLAPLAPLQRGVIDLKDAPWLVGQGSKSKPFLLRPFSSKTLLEDVVDDEEQKMSQIVDCLSPDSTSLEELELERKMMNIIMGHSVTEKLRDEHPVECVNLAKSWIVAVKNITHWFDDLKFNVSIHGEEYGDMSPAIMAAWTLYQKEKGV